jgi:hypothetical protein
MINRLNFAARMPFVLRVKRGFSPLDEELDLLPGRLTPTLQEHLVRLSAWMPFERAAKELEAFSQVRVSEPTARRTAEAAGAAYVAQQSAPVEAIERTTPEPPLGPPIQLLSVDGAMVPLVHQQWSEVKTLVVGEVSPPVIEQGAAVVHVTELSYFSRLAEAEEFDRQALVETQRRGVERAEQVSAVTDGALGEQGFIDLHRKDAVRILDFPHAAEHLAKAGQVVYAEATPELKQWLGDQLHELKHGSAEVVLDQLRRLRRRARRRHLPQADLMQEHFDYLEQRRAMLAYREFQAAGYPIGSGAVESGNKLVVEMRLKGPGMHWAPAKVNPMLALRNIVCSDRWAEAWPEIERLQRQRVQQREARWQERPRESLRAAEPSVKPVPEGLPPGATHPPQGRRVTTLAHPPSAHACRPAADHPWRHSPIGRARFQPSRGSGYAKA